MQSTPPDINLTEIKKQVETIKGIIDFHHVHVRKLYDTQIHLEAHINLKNNVNMEEMMKIKNEIEQLLKSTFKINHITLQIEYKPCAETNKLIHRVT